MTAAEEPKKLLFISPHVPYPATEGGMIRTCSVLHAIPREWRIHYVVLADSGSGGGLDRLGTIFPNLTVEEYERFAGHDLNVVESLRAAGRFRKLLGLRDKVKRFGAVRAVFRLFNLPYDAYRSTCRYLRRYRFVRARLRQSRFDAVLLDYTKLAFLVPALLRYPAIRILNVHNAESDLAAQIAAMYPPGARRRAALRDRRVYRFYEKHLVPKLDWLLAPSEADAEFHRGNARHLRTVIFPNVVDISRLGALAPAERRDTLIFAGRMDFPPNADAARFLCRAIFPKITAMLPGARLCIVGKNPPLAVSRLSSRQIAVTGYVDDMIPFWREASILVVPLLTGGGTRIKILEAMALGRPVVSTSKGCEGLDVRDQTHLLIADDPDSFAGAVVRLCKDAALYAAIARAGRALVERSYSFDVVARLLADGPLAGRSTSGGGTSRLRVPAVEAGYRSGASDPDFRLRGSNRPGSCS